MNRIDVFKLIGNERASQDGFGPRTERRVQMYNFTAPHLLLLGEKIEAMRTAWYRGESVSSDFVKVAAIAIRALEEITDEKFWAEVAPKEKKIK